MVPPSSVKLYNIKDSVYHIITVTLNRYHYNVVTSIKPNYLCVDDIISNCVEIHKVV